MEKQKNGVNFLILLFLSALSVLFLAPIFIILMNLSLIHIWKAESEKQSGAAA